MSTLIDPDEQFERIKDWWHQYGTTSLIIMTIITIISTGWYYHQQWYQQHVMQASKMYGKLLGHLANPHPSKSTELSTGDLVKQLMTNYSNTSYGMFSGLIAAKSHVKEQQFQSAINKLSWVQEKTADKALKQLIQLRIARVLLTMKKTQQALIALKKVTLPAYLPLVKALQGAILTEMGKKDQARLAYQDALSSIKPSEPIYQLLAMQYNQVLSNHDQSSQ